MLAATLLSLLLGFPAGLRTFAPAAVLAVAAWAGWFDVSNTWAKALAWPWVALAFALVAVGELVGDKLPNTPNRTHWMGVLGRSLSGIGCGAALAAPAGQSVVGGVAGLVGAMAGTYGGFMARVRLARAVGKDWPVALAEDALAVALSLAAVALAIGTMP